MDYKSVIEHNFLQHLQVASMYGPCVDPASEAAQKIVQCLRSGGKILICGNGGSASDANHLAAEFINRYLKDRAPLPAVSLASNPSNLTSTGNDYSFDLVFSKQVEALGNRGDILIAISTSGKSKNIIAALRAAREKKIHSILFTGNAKTESSRLADTLIPVPSSQTPRIQELHLILYHCICEIAESELFGE